MSTAAPERTEQARAALQLANRSRVERSRFRRTAGVDEVVRLIQDPPGWAASWRVETVLMTLPWVGKTRAADICRRGRIPTVAQLGRLNVSQRRLLAADVLRRRGS